jgi:hypothetical protein
VASHDTPTFAGIFRGITSRGPPKSLVRAQLQEGRINDDSHQFYIAKGIMPGPIQLDTFGARFQIRSLRGFGRTEWVHDPARILPETQPATVTNFVYQYVQQKNTRCKDRHGAGEHYPNLIAAQPRLF